MNWQDFDCPPIPLDELEREQRRGLTAEIAALRAERDGLRGEVVALKDALADLWSLIEPESLAAVPWRRAWGVVESMERKGEATHADA